MVPFLLLLGSLLLSSVSAQTAVVTSLLTTLAVNYNDDYNSAPPVFREQLLNATNAVFQGTAMNGVPASVLGSDVSGAMTIRRFTRAEASATGAICIDGSPYAYYTRSAPVSSANRDKWVIMMQGGSLCVDALSCTQRSRSPLGSSINYKQYYTDSSNTFTIGMFADWNQVFMPYCSGDVFGGSRTTNSTASWGFYFAGHNITTAVIQDLQAITQPVSEIVVSGISAGGIGSILHVDRFAAAFPRASVIALPLAGWFSAGLTFPQWLTIANANPLSTLPRRDYSTSLYVTMLPLFDVFRFVAPTACVSYYTSINQANNVTAMCSSMPGLYPFVRSAMYIVENKFDTFQIVNLNALPLLPVLNTVNYLGYFGGAMIRSVVQAVATKAATRQAVDGMFIPSCLQHVISLQAVPGYNPAIGSVQPMQAFTSWYNAYRAGIINPSVNPTTNPFYSVDSANVMPLARCSITDAFSLPEVGVRGDPAFVGLQGQKYQVHGIDGMVYNLITHQSLHVNSRFAFLSEGQYDCPIMPSTGRTSKACWSHEGSYLSEIGVRMSHNQAETRIHLIAGSAKQGFESILVNGQSINPSTHSFISQLSTHEIRVTIAPFTLEIENIDGFLNLRTVYVSKVDLLKLRSHGLLGQTWRNKAVNPGKLPMIEGDVDEYMIQEDDVFGTTFPYNQYRL